MKTLNIKPGGVGLVVRDPVTKAPLAAEGEEKPATAYWMRRLKDGDVVETTAKGGKK